MAIDFITGAEDVISGVLKFFPNAEDKAKAQDALLDFQEKVQALDAQKYQADIDLLKAQIETNNIEAASKDRFVSGWRPFAGWSFAVLNCVLSLFLCVMVYLGKSIEGYLIVYQTNMGFLAAIMGMRTFEKFQGIAASSDNDPAPAAQAKLNVQLVPGKEGKLPRA